MYPVHNRNERFTLKNISRRSENISPRIEPTNPNKVRVSSKFSLKDHFSLKKLRGLPNSRGLFRNNGSVDPTRNSLGHSPKYKAYLNHEVMNRSVELRKPPTSFHSRNPSNQNPYNINNPSNIQFKKR